MPDADQQVIIEFVARTEKAIADAAVFQEKIDAVRETMRRVAKETGASWKDIGAGMKDLFKSANIEQFNAALQQMNLPQVANNAKALTTAKQEMSKAVTQATSELNKETKELQANTKATQENASTTSVLNDIIRIAFGVGIGQIATQAIRAFVGYLKEATQSGFEFTKAVFQLEIGVRALRRAGVDIVTPEVLANLDRLREKFGVFSQKELVQGQAQLLNLVRDMGFTKEQIFGLTDAVATLAIVNGRSMEDVQRTVALALSSGYTEGLQRLGVSINRVTIAQKAAEMGYAGNYMALNEVQRAAATYALILEKTAKYSNDVAKYTATMTGQIEVAGATIKDNTQRIGQAFLPIKKIWTEFLAFMSGGLLTFMRIYSTVVSTIPALFETARDVLRGENFWKSFEDASKRFLENLKLIWGGMPQFFGDTIAQGVAQGIDDAQEDIEKAFNTLFSDISKLERDYANDRRDAQIDLANDLAKIDRSTQYKIDDINRDAQEKRDKKLKDSSDKIKNLTDKYNLDVIQANRQFNNQAAEQDAKYRERQLKAELDYQEKLKKLREGFLFDLEDALRERDARQILRLIRQYNLQREQAARDYSSQKSELARQRRLEINELETRRAERLQVLAEEFALRLQQIQAETQAELAADEDASQKKIDAIKRDAEREKNERQIRYTQQMNELRLHLGDRIKELIIKLAEEHKLTAEKLALIGNEYLKVYGPNGTVEAAFRYAVSIIKAFNKSMASMYKPVNPATLSPIQQANYPTPTTTGGKTGKAEGGWVYADKPTQVTFGEKGPEMGGFFPVGRIGKEQNTLSMGNVSSPNMGGQVDIRLILSPDLEARIVNNTLNKTARILMEVEGMVR